MSPSLTILDIALVDLARPGGDTEHVIGVATGLARAGHQVTLAALADGAVDPRLRIPGLEVVTARRHRNPYRNGPLLRWVVRDLLRTRRFDAAYIRTFPGDGLLLAGLLGGLPVVAEINGMIDTEYRANGHRFKAWLYDRLTRPFLRRADLWMPVTDEIGRWAERVAGVSRPRRIALNGMTPFPPGDPARRAKLRADHGVRDDEVVLIMAGFASPWHGLELAFAALARLPSRFRLWLVGTREGVGGAGLETIRARAGSAGVASRVTALPWQSQEGVTGFLEAADIGLGALRIDCKALSEAQPMKVAHSLAAGLPVVFNHADPRFPDGLPFALRVAPNDAVALAEGIIELSERLAPALREEARRYAGKSLTWDHTANETIAALRSVLPP
jgi:glycosyltransferase involved in cell wall biosynthesis